MINITQKEIMKNWQGDINQPLVSVRCITYNHENYIAQALDGFLMQKTNFPFEVIVHDDASPDRTADIIREYEKKYPKIIKAIYQTENQYSKRDGTIARIMNEACKGKYIALCEGDDYWIDENKLQIQVGFLEGNPEYGMCYTRVKVYEQNKKEFQGTWGESTVTLNDLIYVNGIPTLTTVFSFTLYKKYLEEIIPSDKGWLLGDLPMWLWFSGNSKIKFLDKITSVYRVLPESASHNSNYIKQIDFLDSTYAIRRFFLEYYNLDYSLDEKYTSELTEICYNQLKCEYTNDVANLLRQQIKKQQSKGIQKKILPLATYTFFTFRVFEFFLRIIKFTATIKQLVLSPIKFLLKKVGLFDTVKRLVKGKK